MVGSARARFGLATVADGCALIGLRPDFGRLARQLAQPQRWVAAVGADRAAAVLAGAAVWCLAGWIAVGVLAMTARALPGSIGVLGDGLARRVLPGALYRLAAGAVGLGVLVTPVAAAAHPAGARGTANTATASTAGTASTARWSTPVSVAPPGRPAPTWPTDPALPTPNWPTTRAPAAGPPAPARVSVEPGDSLWSIAATQLGPHPNDSAITTEWHRWYAVNRHVIGPNPSRLTPGQVLRAPLRPSSEEST